MVAISVLSLHLSERPFCGSGWLLGCDDPVPDLKTDELHEYRVDNMPSFNFRTYHI